MLYQRCQEAFNHLENALFTAPILAYPTAGCQFIVDTDASNVGIGGVLSKMQDGEERLISPFLKTLSKAITKGDRVSCLTFDLSFLS